MDHREYILQVPGSAVAVLLIHGICGTPAHFRQLLPLFPEDWSVYNLLLDGHGKGVKEFSATSMAKWKAQVSRHLSQLRASHDQVLIVAHSMGTLFAIEEAVKDPEKLAGLFLLNVPLYARLPVSTILTAVGAALGMTRYGAVRAVVDDCSITLSPRLWQYLGWIPRYWELLQQMRAVRALLPRLTVPTHSFHSCNDELVSGRSCPLLEDHPAIQHTSLPLSGHFQYHPSDMTELQRSLQNQIDRL